MNRFDSSFRLFAIACLTLTFSALTVAAPQFYVASKNNDANVCDRISRCATVRRNHYSKSFYEPVVERREQ